MKQFILLSTLFLIFQQHINAQIKPPQNDQSAMDISYYPKNYPLLKIQDKLTDPLIARLIYSRPLKNGREIFGNLIQYGKVWRLGANEATEIEFYQHVKLNNSKIKKGRYTLYAIPNEDKWTIIINSETDIWGSFKYDFQKDIFRMEVPVEKQSEITESFSMVFDKTAEGFSLFIFWDEIKINIPFTL